jgi:formylglycine-generating enzyme required for sulfatase activity
MHGSVPEWVQDWDRERSSTSDLERDANAEIYLTSIGPGAPAVNLARHLSHDEKAAVAVLRVGGSAQHNGLTA